MSKSLEFNRKLTAISPPQPQGKRWWQVLLFIVVGLIWIEKMHNIGGFKFENFTSKEELQAQLIKMCPIGTTNIEGIIYDLRKAGAECAKIPKSSFINPFDIPQITKYIWFCDYWTTWLPFKGRTKYVVKICLDSEAEVVALISGLWTYKQLFL